MSRRRVGATREAQLAQWARDQRFRALNADDCAPSSPAVGAEVAARAASRRAC
jgi:hypothetical protein